MRDPDGKAAYRRTIFCHTCLCEQSHRSGNGSVFCQRKHLRQYWDHPLIPLADPAVPFPRTQGWRLFAGRPKCHTRYLSAHCIGKYFVWCFVPVLLRRKTGGTADGDSVKRNVCGQFLLFHHRFSAQSLCSFLLFAVFSSARRKGFFPKGRKQYEPFSRVSFRADKSEAYLFWSVHIGMPVIGALLFTVYYLLYDSTADEKKLQMMLELTTISPADRCHSQSECRVERKFSYSTSPCLAHQTASSWLQRSSFFMVREFWRCLVCSCYFFSAQGFWESPVQYAQKHSFWLRQKLPVPI